MSYPTQKGTLNRLEAETIKARRVREAADVAAIASMWNATKQNIRESILGHYHIGHGSKPWNTRTSGRTLEAMGRATMEKLENFYQEASYLVRASIRSAYKYECARQVWMLDSLTPPSYVPRLPARALREAAGEDVATWNEALAAWLKAYGANLGTNLSLEALKGGSITDAADRVDSTKVDGYDPSYKLSSMVTNEVLGAEREAREDVGDENDDLVVEEVFQTMEDSAVCPDCGSQDGVIVSDVDVFGHVYGFNCRCFERIVPRSFAELLRNGDEDEKAAALLRDARGLIPDSMAIMGPNGDLVGHFTVPFATYVQGRADMSAMNLWGGL